MTGTLPRTASVTRPAGDAKLHAPAAVRNRDAICDMLCTYAPQNGRALEIASGTGEHIVAFAAALPNLHWQPTEPDTPRRASIDAYVAEAGLQNVSPAVALDATAVGWHKTVPQNDLVFLANLLHLIPATSVQNLITEAALAMAPGGTLVLYGPFARDGVLTSEGDVQFDSALRAADPSIGYKATNDLTCWLDGAGLIIVKVVEMPANNLSFIARKP